MRVTLKRLTICFLDGLARATRRTRWEDWLAHEITSNDSKPRTIHVAERERAWQRLQDVKRASVVLLVVFGTWFKYRSS